MTIQIFKIVRIESLNKVGQIDIEKSTRVLTSRRTLQRNAVCRRRISNDIDTAYLYRGFIRKGDRVHIITFRDTTRMQSKSNRCI